MALSKRLLALYRMVEQGSVVADIGCDHGQLSIALVEQGVAPHIYACDLRSGPLSRAKEAVKQAGLEAYIDCYMRNGLDDLPSDVTTVIIAGMGFDTIKGILEAHMEELTENRTFIIQSNKHVDELRRWISKHGFTILKEDIVEEDHFYEIVSFQPIPHEPYSERECLFGVSLSEHTLFQTYWKFRLTQVEEILSHMPADHIRRYEVEALRKAIQTAL